MIVEHMVGKPTLGFSVLFAMLAACVPVPTTTGPHLRPDYRGQARVEVGTTCEEAIPYIWIFGPQDVRQKVLVRKDEAGRAMLELSAMPLKGLASEMPPITVLSVTSGKMHTVAAESVEITGALWIAKFPLPEGLQATYRVRLPAIDVKPEAWSPGVVELRPTAARPYLPPLNC